MVVWEMWKGGGTLCICKKTLKEKKKIEKKIKQKIKPKDCFKKNSKNNY